MRAVILAAGDGGRLGVHTAALPKPLISLAGRPIVDYTIAALREAGVDEALVVTGYREGQIVGALAGRHPSPTLSFVSNPRFHGGASLSLRAARPYCGDEPFLLVMSDHLLSIELVSGLLEAGHGGGFSFVAADFSPRDAAYAAEATKIAFADPGSPSRVTGIGKHIEGWSALDTGAFVLVPEIWEAVASAPEDCELSVIFSELAARGRLFAADVSGAFWYDIDTTDDLIAASALIRSRSAVSFPS
jgi:choline kinase